MKSRTLAYILAAFILGGVVASLQYHAAITDLEVEVNQLKSENVELIELLEEGR